jgi:hypothetical protein
MTTPTVPYDWATAAIPADISAPPSGVRLSGYGLNDQFDHDEFNYLMNALGQWIDNMSSSGLVFPGAGAAEDSGLLSVNDVFTIPAGSPLGDGLMFESFVDATGTNDVTTISGNGVYTIMDNSATTIVAKDAFDVTSSAAPMGNLVACGPTHYVTVLGSTVRLHTYPGSVAVWSYSHGAAINSVAIDAEYVYIAGVSGTSGGSTGTHRAISIATGLMVWTDAWGATLKSVYATGASIFVAGAIGTATYAMAEVNRSSGAIIRHITLPGGAIVTRHKSLYTDGVTIYVMSDTGLHASPFSSNTADASILSAGIMCADDTFLYIIFDSTSSSVSVLKKTDLLATPNRITPLNGAVSPTDMYSDSRHLFVGYALTTGKSWSIYRVASQPKRYVYKNTVGGTFLPTGSLYCPETIQY